jgi:hypothetical protein
MVNAMEGNVQESVGEHSANVGAATKTCSICAAERPLAAFRRRRRDSERRHSECNLCRSLADRQRRADKKARAVRAWATEMNQFADSIGVLGQCCHAVIQRVGGVQAFAALFARELERESVAGKVRLLMAVFRAQMAVDGYGRR